MKCVQCGEDFQVSEARIRYDSYVSTYNNSPSFDEFDFNFDYDSDFSSGNRFCNFCAIQDVEERVQSTLDDAGVVDIDENDEPECNSWCGGYPASCGGCNLADENR